MGPNTSNWIALTDISDIEFREELMVLTLALEPDLHSSPKRLRQGVREALRSEGLNDEHDTVSLAFWRLMGRGAIELTEDRSAVRINPAFDDPVWRRLEN